MLAFSRLDDVHLAAAGSQRSHRAADSEENEFRRVAKVEPDTAAVWSSVLPDLVPDEVRLVGEPPGFHHGQTLSEQCVGYP